MGGNRPSLRKALVVFENRNYRYLWASSLVSFTGMQMQQITRAVIAWELTESFTAVSAIFLSFGLPMLLFSLIGGAFADRLNKRNLTLVTQVATGILMLITAFLLVSGLITIELLFIIGLVQGVFFAFGMPARSPLMATVVGPQQLMSAMALQNAAMNGTRLIGPALAGLFMWVQGVESAYFVQSGLYAVSVALLLVVPSHLGRASAVERKGMFTEIGNGLRYAVTDRNLRTLMMLAFVTAIFAMPYMALLNGFVEEDLGQGPSAFSFLMLLTGAGGLIGSLIIAAFTEFDRKPLLQLVVGLLSGLGLIVLGLGSEVFGFGGAIAGSLILGLMLTGYQTLNMTMVMGVSKPEYYGRVMSIMMLTFSTMPMMAVPLGILADEIGASAVFSIQGVVVAALLVVVALTNVGFTFGREENAAAMASAGSSGRPESGAAGGG
jgi:predicted MFS family arabinose efflux permease